MTKYYFDKEAADRAVSFIEKFITHTKGELAGKPLLLEGWQKDITEKIFGWKHKDTGFRKYKTAFIMLPRKNGKTTWAASLSLLMLFADSERGGEIYAAAGDRSQSGISHEIAKGMVLNHPALRSRAKVLRNSIVNESKTNFFQAISSDSKTKHGFNANCIIFDELHTQPNRDLWDTLLTSTGSRREPLVIDITTAGYDKNSNQSYFVHNLFNTHLDYVYSYYYKNFTVFWKKLGIKSLMRAKINLYVKTHKIEEHYPHVDFPFEHKGCLFSFNTCDGYIKLEDGTKIESVANRALLFEPNKPHSSTSTTNAKGRFNLNLNYF